jgi:NADPH-dependent 2,4-dienoyl-CoA reductase/sulfur reductase-like enzyme
MTIAADDRVLVVGAGVGAVALVRELRTAGYAGRATLLDGQAHEPYDRPPLSKQLLAGTLGTQDIMLFAPGELAELEVDLALGSPAVCLDPEARTVCTADGARHAFTTAVIATGARARHVESIPEMAGVHYLRSVDDSLRLAGGLRRNARVVILGAGFIGLEAAAVAAEIGCRVTVAEAAPCPLARVLRADPGSLITDMHTQHGVDIRCSSTVTGVVGEETLEAVVINGETVPADLLLVGVGAIPNTEWLAGSGVLVDDGVVCDSSGRTNLVGVFAVGDVGRWRNARTGEHRRVEQWQPAVEQARTVARVIAQPDVPCEWDSVPYFWSDQYGRKLQLCGAPGPETFRRETARGALVCFGRDDELTGVLSISNPRALAQGRRLIGSPWHEAITWAEQLP